MATNTPLLDDFVSEHKISLNPTIIIALQQETCDDTIQSTCDVFRWIMSGHASERQSRAILVNDLIMQHLDWADHLAITWYEWLKATFGREFPQAKERARTARTTIQQSRQVVDRIKLMLPFITSDRHHLIWNQDDDPPGPRRYNELNKIRAYITAETDESCLVRSLARAYLYRQWHAPTQAKFPLQRQRAYDWDTITASKVTGESELSAAEHIALHQFGLTTNQVGYLIWTRASHDANPATHDQNDSAYSNTSYRTPALCHSTTLFAKSDGGDEIIDQTVSRTNKRAFLDDAEVGSTDEELDGGDNDSVDYVDESDDDPTDGDYVEELPTRKKPRTGAGLPSRVQHCSCQPQVTAVMKAMFEATQLSMRAYQPLFKRLLSVITTLKQSIVDDANHENPICRLHMYLPLQQVGYIVRNLDNSQLLDCMNEWATHHDPVELYRKAPSCYRFKESFRVPRRIQERGGWKYEARKEEPFTFDAVSILNAHFPGAWDTFQKDGATSNSIFGWLFDQQYGDNGRPIAEVLMEEFRVYEWHFSRRAAQSDMGWLRNCFHSIIQQLIRQDLLYYIVYCCLREDKATTLISYPYYAKKTNWGSKTAFHHMDINPSKLLHGTGRFMIQGWVSLTDEEENHCTEMVLGMHRWVSTWWDGVVAENRHVGSSGAVVDMDRTDLISQADRHRFGFRYTPSPCKRGDAMVFHPSLAHGSLGPALNERILVLPWFVRVDDNGSLEVPESGTWSDLSANHRELSHPTKTPSGYPNMYGAPTTAFPAALPLLLDDPVSNALMGRLSWTSTAVREQREVLLDANRIDEAKTVILRSRKNAAKKALALFREMAKLERKLYGDRSYFECKEKDIPAPDADDPDPDL